MTSIDTDYDTCEPVVIKSSDFIKPSFSDTIPAEYMHTEQKVNKSLNPNYESYCNNHSDAKIISILEKNNIQPNNFKCDKSKLIVPDILCIKMELIDFPLDTYTLNILGKNVKTSKHNIFDFTTEMTNAMIEINKMEQILDNSKDKVKHVNFIQIRQNDWVSIGHNKKTVLKDIQYVKLFGYILEDNTWKYHEQITKLYSNKIISSLHENYVTPFMDFYFDYDTFCPKSDDIIFTIYVDSHKYIELTHADIKKKMNDHHHRQFLRIPFICFSKDYYSDYTQYDQPEIVIKNALNFNRIDNFIVITKFITLRNIVQWRYKRYLYPEMVCVDSC